MKKTTSTILAILIAALAPGWTAYASAAEVARGSAGPRPIAAVSVPVNSAGTALQGLGTGLPGTGALAPADAAGLEAAAAGLAPAPSGAQAAAVPAPAPAVPGLAPAAPAVGPAAASGSSLNSASQASAAAAPAAPEPGGGAAAGAPLRGWTLLLIGSKDVNRRYQIERAKLAAEKLGLRLLFMDEAKKRELSQGIIPDADFIPVQSLGTKPEEVEAAVQAAVEASKAVRIDRVYTLLNPHVELKGRINDRLRLPGDSGEATASAHTKSIARQIIAEKLPELATPFAVVKNRDEARQAFTDISAKMGRSVKVVMKPIHGGGSQGVKKRIASADEAAATYEVIDRFLIDFQKRPDAGFEMLDTHPGIMMELMLEGPEVDVEIIKSAGRLGFGRVLDNAEMDGQDAVEKNIAAPSQLSEAAQVALVAAASRILEALNLGYGNYHVEMMDTPEGPRLLEVNARMGGAHVFKVVERIFSVDLIEQGFRGVFGLPVDAGREATAWLESRFFIPKFTGRVLKVEGVEAAKATAGVEDVQVFKKPGDTAVAPPDDTFDYMGYVTGTGATYAESMENTLAGLRKVKFTIQGPDGKVLVQRGDHTQAPKSTAASLLEAFVKLPSSFKSFLLGGGLRTMAEEGMAILTAIYGISQFGLLAGILSQAAEVAARIPGSLFAAKWVKRFDAKRIYMITTTFQGLLYLSLPLGAALFGVASPLFLAHYFFVQVMRGLIYGAVRGMAENQIMPRLVGQDVKRLETANFIWMVTTETFAIGMAFVLAPIVRALFGINATIGVAAAIMLASVVFFKKIKFTDLPQAGAAQEAGAPAADEDADKADKLPLREYIPYVSASYMHFSFYTLFAGVFATFTFNDQFMADKAIGTYDAGSLVIALVAAIPGLLASIGTVAKAAGVKTGVFGRLVEAMDKVSLKAWYGAAVVAALAFYWAGVAGASLIALGAAATLGALTTVNRGKWMSSYQSRLKKDKHAKMIATANSLGVLAALLPFAAISIGKVLGIALSPVILGIAIALTIGLVASYFLSRNPGESKK